VIHRTLRACDVLSVVHALREEQAAPDARIGRWPLPTMTLLSWAAGIFVVAAAPRRGAAARLCLGLHDHEQPDHEAPEMDGRFLRFVGGGPGCALALLIMRC